MPFKKKTIIFIFGAFLIAVFLLLNNLHLFKSIQTYTSGINNAKDAIVNVKWLGPKSIKLSFNNEPYSFSNGESKKIILASSWQYIVHGEKPNKSYAYNDSVSFCKGEQYISIDLNDDSLVVLNPGKLLNQLNDQMVLVTGGKAPMAEINESDSHEKKTGSKSIGSFFISKYDITQEQWKIVMGNNPSYFNHCSQCPIEKVSWNDIQEFLSRLNEHSIKHFRLPLEIEWEYAAKGGNKSLSYKYAGSNDLDSASWYSANSQGATHPVGQKKPNELGLYDMTGNVWQWCNDYNEEYPGRKVLNNVEGPQRGLFRIVRGGSWLNHGDDSGVQCKDWINPDTRDGIDGFRLVQDF
jgi:formylglycine-generating enzyme required for sulfatase activity